MFVLEIILFALLQLQLANAEPGMKGSMEYFGPPIGMFNRSQFPNHNLEGQLFAMDEKRLYLVDFSFRSESSYNFFTWKKNQTSENGVKVSYIKDELSSIGKKDGQNLILHAPKKSWKNYVVLGINLDGLVEKTGIKFPKDLKFPAVQKVGPLTGENFKGQVHISDHRTITIRNFTANFTCKFEVVTRNGQKKEIRNPTGTFESDRIFEKDTVELMLPLKMTVFDVKQFSIIGDGGKKKITLEVKADRKSGKIIPSSWRPYFGQILGNFRKSDNVTGRLHASTIKDLLINLRDFGFDEENCKFVTFRRKQKQKEELECVDEIWENKNKKSLILKAPNNTDWKSYKSLSVWCENKWQLDEIKIKNLMPVEIMLGKIENSKMKFNGTVIVLDAERIRIQNFLYAGSNSSLSHGFWIGNKIDKSNKPHQLGNGQRLLMADRKTPYELMKPVNGTIDLFLPPGKLMFGFNYFVVGNPYKGIIHATLDTNALTENRQIMGALNAFVPEDLIEAPLNVFTKKGNETILRCPGFIKPKKPMVSEGIIFKQTIWFWCFVLITCFLN